MSKPFKDLEWGEQFKFKGNDTVCLKLRCPNEPNGCYALCVTGNEIHKPGDLFISKTNPNGYHEQEMLLNTNGAWT